MPFPKSDREVYERNPLKEVICQLRFPTILQVTAEPPAQFQNSIRSSYPLYSEENAASGLPKEVAGIIAGLALPNGLPQPTHKFLTDDESRLISLSQDSIAVSEKKYQRWQCFREETELAESAFRNIYHPSFYSRIGLRYRDILDREELGLKGCPWAELLNLSFIGELGALDISDEIKEIRTQSLVSLPDVHNGFVSIQHGLTRTSDNGREVYVIDADFYTQERSELDHAFKILDAFNKWAGRLFRWAITGTLRNALGPTKIQ